VDGTVAIGPAGEIGELPGQLLGGRPRGAAGRDPFRRSHLQRFGGANLRIARPVHRSLGAQQRGQVTISANVLPGAGQSGVTSALEQPSRSERPAPTHARVFA
jgi:hypothetical protein